MVNRPIGYDLWVNYVNFQSSLIVICGPGPPNFCLHWAARMLRPTLGRSSAGQGKFDSQRPTSYHCATPPSSKPNLKKNNLLVTVKIRTSGYQTLECFSATLPTQGVYGCLVCVGETFNRFADFGL